MLKSLPIHGPAWWVSLMSGWLALGSVVKMANERAWPGALFFLSVLVVCIYIFLRQEIARRRERAVLVRQVIEDREGEQV